MWTEFTRIKIAGKDTLVSAWTGEVMDTNQRSDTYVSGGGTISSLGNHVSGNVSIDSEVLVTRDIFLKNSGGKEKAFQFHFDLPMRTGHKLSVIRVSSPAMTDRKNYPDGQIIGVYNHTTETWRNLPGKIGYITGLTNLLSFLASAVMIVAVGLGFTRQPVSDAWIIIIPGVVVCVALLIFASKVQQGYDGTLRSKVRAAVQSLG